MASWVFVPPEQPSRQARTGSFDSEVVTPKVDVLVRSPADCMMLSWVFNELSTLWSLFWQLPIKPSSFFFCQRAACI